MMTPGESVAIKPRMGRKKRWHDVMGAKFPWYLLADTVEGHAKEQSLTAQVLPKQEFGGEKVGFGFAAFGTAIVATTSLFSVGSR